MDTGITFTTDLGEYHTYYDLNLKQLADLEITPAEAKRHLITDIASIDGDVDVTDFFGGVRFKNRTITAVFEGQDQSFDEWCKVCETVNNILHGKMARMVLDIDPEWYWQGFLTVTPTKEAIAYSEIAISCDAFPYKRRTRKHTYTIPGSKTITVQNARMPAKTKLTCSSSFTLNVNGNTYALKSGENTPEFWLSDGINAMAFAGTGTVTIEWTEGSL